MNSVLNLSSSPHARDSWTTRSVMMRVLLALAPASVLGVINYGLYALLILLLGVASAVATELIFDRIAHKPNTWTDGSAAVTGLLLALSLSPSVPVYIPVFGSVFAILVVKCCFGGLGKNFINPALAGRCFLLISFGRVMSTFKVDAVASATPIAEMMNGGEVNITEMFLGSSNAVIGSSILALLVGGLALWAFDIIHGQICFSVIGGFVLMMALFGGQGFDLKYLLAHLCGGGVIMGAFFMATDYVTSPVSRLGQTIYGILIGVLGGLFRLYGGTADAFSYSIIIGNLFTPLIDTYFVQKPYAYRARAVRLRSGDRRSFWQRIPKPVYVLTAITLIAGVALSGVFSVTKHTIEEQKRLKNAQSYSVVCPDAEEFEPDDEADDIIENLAGSWWGEDYGKSVIKEAMIAKGDDGKIVGYVVRVSTSDAYDGSLTLVVGTDPNGKVLGISFTELHETPGMGMRCGEAEFMDQFAGKEVDSFVLNKSAMSSGAANEIDTVSGASTSSGAVVKAVNAGLDFVRNVMMGGRES